MNRFLEYYEKALLVTEEASVMMKEGYESVKSISTKSGYWDVVTEYDKKIEKFLIQNLSETYPTHKFIGEETTENKTVLTDDPTWIIDPIDGTNNYAIGYPECAISVGLAVNKDVVVGVVANPIKGEIFSACKGKGAFLNGKTIHPTTTTNIHESIIGYEVSLGSMPHARDIIMKRLEALVSKSRGIRSVGCASLSICYVAAGLWDAYQTDFLYPWDYAGGSVIIKEAGGTVLNTQGNEFNILNKSIIAAGTVQLAETISHLIKESDSS